MRRKLCCGNLRARTNIARMSEGSGTPPPGQPAGGKRPAIGLQIKLPCASLDDVKARYTDELRQNQFFVRTRTPRPKDTLVRLEAHLAPGDPGFRAAAIVCERSEEHTSELQSLRHLVCRLLLEKKKKNQGKLRRPHRQVGLRQSK